jgi:hypothetical protein
MKQTRSRWSDFDDDQCVNDVTAAALIGLSFHTLRQWRSRKDPAGPRFVRAGSRCVYRISSLRRWLDRNEVATTDDPSPENASLRRAG